MADPSGRFRTVRANQLLAPGVCAVCGGGSDERTFVEFGLDIEFFGVVYICNYCFYEAAENFNLVTYELFAARTTEAVTANAELVSAQMRVAELEGIIDGLSGIISRRGVEPSVAGLGLVAEGITPDAAEARADAIARHPAGKGARAQSETSESALIQGPDDGSGVISSLKDFGL